MLIACSSCHRQYETGGLPTGSKLRCYCGARMEIPDRKPGDAPVMHCASCGAGIAQGATTCEYCQAALRAGSRGYGEACPKCFARMLKDAKFCSGCGTEIRVEAVIRALGSQQCPRCAGRLALCEFSGAAYTECTQCAGVWLDEKVFDTLVETRERSALAACIGSAAVAQPARADGNEPMRYLKCPACAEIMHRKNFGEASGVIIDWCKGHGYWFDPNELERIYAFVQRGGLEQARERKKHRAEEELRRIQTQVNERRSTSTSWPAPPIDFELRRPGLLDLVYAIGGWLTRERTK